MATFQNTRTEIQEIKIILKNAQNQPKKKKKKACAVKLLFPEDTAY